MLCTTAAQSVSKNITCTSVRMRGVSALITARASRGKGREGKLACPKFFQLRQHCGGDFLRRHRFHAAKIDRALAQKTGAAFHVMTDDDMIAAERAGEPMLGRAKDGD